MAKRSRVGTATTLAGDTDVINYVTQPQWQYCSAPIPAPVNGLNSLQIEPSFGFGREASSVFTLGSPERGDVVCVGGERIELLFEQCFYCKKRFDKTKPVFMYSERAFCETDCRKMQILEDKKKERVAAKRKVED